MTGVWAIIPFAIEFVVKAGFILGILLRRGRRNSASTLAWIVIILAIPIVGIIAYLLVGEVRLGRRRVARHREFRVRLEASSAVQPNPASLAPEGLNPVHRHIATLAEAVGDDRACGGNQLRLLGDSDLFIQSLVEDIDAAKVHCHLLFYIVLDDHAGRRVCEALGRAAQRGVACRLLVDAVGSRPFLNSALCRQTQAAGVQVVGALPANFVRVLFARLDVRNHRKLAAIDGVIGYVGSHNLADAEFAIKPKFAPWVDAMVRVEGPAVRDLQELFVADWYTDTSESLEETLKIMPPPAAHGVTTQIIGSGPYLFNEALRQLSETAFHLAREELILTTPYFVPDEATITAIVTTARRGVDTRLVIPARNDSPMVAAACRSYFDSLLDAGVKIHLFQGGLLHAKTITIDRDLAVIMSANLDRRSFELNFEVSMVVYDTDFASQLRFLQMDYINRSRKLKPLHWKRRPWPRRLWQNAAGLLGPLL